jgi:type II secretion system protein I
MKRDRQQQGYMLLEVVLASMLVAIGLAVMLSSLGRCLAAARGIQNYTIAETVLANKCYDLRMDLTNYLPQEGDCEDFPGFKWRRDFEETETEGLWKQTVTVYWNERSREVSDSVVEYRYLPEKQR